MDKHEKVKEKLLKYFKENEEVFNEVIEELDSLDGYLYDNRFYEMEELPDFVNSNSRNGITELLMRVHFGKDLDSEDRPFNPMRDYFRFNCYGNLESTDEIDYSEYLDDEFLEAVIENKDDLYSVRENSEIQEILEMEE